MRQRFQWFVWAAKYRARRVLGEGSSTLGRLFRLAMFAALLAGGLQLALLGGARWDDGVLEADLFAELGPHQSMRAMEQIIAARVLRDAGVDASVRVRAICPAPGAAGALDEIAPTCLLAGDVEYERTVLWVHRRTHLRPTKKVFRDTIPLR